MTTKKISLETLNRIDEIYKKRDYYKKEVYFADKYKYSDSEKAFANTMFKLFDQVLNELMTSQGL